jgi:hypothetical protein
MNHNRRIVDDRSAIVSRFDLKKAGRLCQAVYDRGAIGHY